jgi:3-oxoacyl-[acyl-carrier protein] reductase
MGYVESQFSLAGKRALVTGASRGIGRATAEALAAAGADVVVHYNRSSDAAENVVQLIRKSGGRAEIVQADLGSAADINRMFETIRGRWNALDILVNNAGDMWGRSPLADMDDAAIDHVLRVNLTGTMLVTRAAIPLLKSGNQPAIVNLSSVAAHNGGAGGVTVYAAAKGGIHTLTRGLAKELGPTIRVNAIAPGFIMTDIHQRFSTPERLDAATKATPLARVGSAEECASVIVFLCAPASAFITGEVIEVNGGLWLA